MYEKGFNIHKRSVFSPNVSMKNCRNSSFSKDKEVMKLYLFLISNLWIFPITDSNEFNLVDKFIKKENLE